MSAHTTHDYADPSLPPRLCQNCATALRGPYCSACGQHDIDYHRSFHHLTHDLLENLFHFEGKFFVTIAWLLAKPGRLTREFLAGRRQSQLNPLRLYLFVSVMFFLGVTLLNHGHLFDYDRKQLEELQLDVGSQAAEIQATLAALTPEQRAGLDRRIQAMSEEAGALAMSDPARLREILADVAPTAAEAGARPATLTSRSDRITEKLASGKLKVADVVEAIEHRVPTLLFLGVPLFALWLKFFQRRRDRYYIEHLIFSLHLHTWAFLAAMVGNGYLKLSGLGPDWLTMIVMWALVAWAAWYVLAAFRNVYEQSWARTIAKSALLAGAHLFTLLLAAIGLVMGTVFWFAL